MCWSRSDVVQELPHLLWSLKEPTHAACKGLPRTSAVVFTTVAIQWVHRCCEQLAKVELERLQRKLLDRGRSEGIDMVRRLL